MDEAAIYTIHSWSSRMLRQHAFDSQSLFDQKRLDDAPALKLKLVKDYWRQFIYPLEAKQLGALKALGATPDTLLKNIQTLWQKFEKSPGGFPDPAQDPDPKISLQVWTQWHEVCGPLESLARQLLAPHMQVALTQLARHSTKTLKATSTSSKSMAFSFLICLNGPLVKRQTSTRLKNSHLKSSMPV